MFNVRHLARLLAPFALVGLCACEPPTPLKPGSFPQTSRLQISADGSTLYVALADHDLVRAIDAASGDIKGDVSVIGHPHRITRLSDGRIAVSARYAGQVSIVDVEAGRVEATAQVGSDPFGLVELDGSLFVAVGGEGDLARIDLSDPNRVASRIVVSNDPRGLAVNAEGKLLVSHFTDGKLSVVDPSAERVREVDMRFASKQFFFPNQMDSITVAPNGVEAAVPHVECNNDPAQFGANGTAQDLVGTVVQYYVSGPTGYPAVVPAVSRVDAVAGVLLSDENRPAEVATGLVPEEAGPAPAVMNPLDRTMLAEENVNGPSAVAFADGDALELVVARGSGNVLVRRSFVAEGQASLIAHVDVDVGADSIVLSPDGAIAYVYNAFDDTVHTFRVPVVTEATSKYGASRGSGEAFLTRAEPFDEIDVEKSFTVAEPILPDQVRRGRVLFHSVENRLTSFGAIACASCHPGGGDDGTTWQFAEGPRQSPPLWGGILGTEPFHWDQRVIDMADISRVTIQGRMGGTGLGRDDMNAIGAFLDQIPAPAPKTTADVGSIDRGAEIFMSAEAGCTQCHSGPDFTDNLAHDVRTGALYIDRETLVELATPPLKGLVHTAPYLHDGSARTIRDVVERLVVTDRMGTGSHLSDQDIVDLVAFLEAI